ncbi:hypothetical protein CDAR_551621 [Caerostris darwini]|uniref:Uncharacterized protein n=1 Tax=Caerostris darwini TaxID=1538125 RepID=A0AAV4V6S7_9ARAC|nr:hypothetical protein CDAR_551621 [Caerostris darwini]
MEDHLLKVEKKKKKMAAPESSSSSFPRVDDIIYLSPSPAEATSTGNLSNASSPLYIFLVEGLKEDGGGKRRKCSSPSFYVLPRGQFSRYRPFIFNFG